MEKNILEIFDLDEKEFGRYDFLLVDSIKVFSEDRIIKVYVRAKGFITQSEINTLEKKIKEIYNNEVEIDFVITYESEMNREEFIKDYLEWLKTGLKNKKPLMYAILNSARIDIEDNLIRLHLKELQSEMLEENEFRLKIVKDFREKYNMDINIEYNHIETEEEFFSLLKEEEIKKVKALECKTYQPSEAPVKEADTGRSVWKEKEVPVTIDSSSDVIFGYMIKEESTTMKELVPEDGLSVVISGEVFGLEDRETKSGKILITFFITDNTYSNTVKLFLSKEKAKPLLGAIKESKALKVKGVYQYDTYQKEYVIMARNIEKSSPLKKRMDNYEGELKRVELHAHTKMSEMDAICSAEELIKTAARWGHKAVAITDHGNVQAFTEAAKNKVDGLKIIYGVEAYVVDDLKKIVHVTKDQTFDDEFVVFDIETTGLSTINSKITELGAVKIKDGKVIDNYSSFVNPEEPIPENITKLTGITDEMVSGARTIKEVLPEFLEFVGDAAVVAHNTAFDTGFIRHNATENYLKFENSVVDTLGIARALFPNLKNHKLDTLSSHLNVVLEGHHRAVNDAKATADVFLKMVQILRGKKVDTISKINELIGDVDPKSLLANHCIILAKNSNAIKYLYRLISDSHVKYFKRTPRMPKSEILKYREHFIIGSACAAGEIVRALLDGKDDEYMRKLIRFYDYLEIQPVENNKFMISSDRIGSINSEEDIRNLNRNIVRLGGKFNKPVVATSDVHFLDPEDALVRKIILTGKGFNDGDEDLDLSLKTTQYMLDEMSYLGKDRAYEVVIKNTNLIADMIEETNPLSGEKCTPVFENAEEELRDICNQNMKKIYGDNPPSEVKDRLDVELNSIISNGYTVLYIIAKKLVEKSVSDGYLVGSRGSVGSSFAAYMAGITEVNSLPAHYVCPECKFADFSSDVVTNFAGNSGCDLPDADCPKCGAQMEKHGHDIPFQTFLGFEGDKEPDIDLNFSGEYQARAHSYTEELFGKGHAYRAGTIGTMADKTAYGFIIKYFEEKNLHINKAEMQRLVNKCLGIKRTSGQHPGGIIVLPKGREIYEFTPIQWPANDDSVALETTHFDYHSIEHNLLKLDILGHDDPSMIRMLEDLTGVSCLDISFSDKKIMSLFQDLSALGIEKEDIGGIPIGTLGVPEFGTNFVIGMVVETKPKMFSDLIRISGLSHGTDVWLGNAQTLIQEGKASIAEVISTRDDIMTFLISRGMDRKMSFKIMESVRKGRGLTEEWEEAMRANGNLPDWYIDSCKKIKYMFPKAHAAAYVTMAWRIAYYKVYYPLAYYAAFFSIRASDFDYELMCVGKKALDDHIRNYELKGNAATTKEKETLKDMRVVQEMYARGFEFLPIDLYKSKAMRFQIEGDKIIPSFTSIQGLGDIVVENIEKEAARGEFISIEDFRDRTKANKTVTDLLIRLRVLDGLPATSQLTLFG